MTRTAGSEHWSIDVPEGWSVREDEDCLSILSPVHEDALQLSSHRKKAGAVSDADLLEFAADHLDAGAPRRGAGLGDFVGFEIAYEVDEFARREWYLRSGQTLLFATYTCAAARAGVRDEEVELALITLKVRGD
ncbi:MAG: hypothetical protein AAF726_13335 [Planctomycetota bacterium]